MQYIEDVWKLKLNYITLNLIEYFMGGGFFAHFVHVDRGGGSQDVHVDKIFKKGTEESWQMTMKSLITSPFVQLWLEDAVHRRWLKTKACVFLCAKSSVIGDKVDIKLHYIELNWIFYGGGAFFAPFVHVEKGGGM